MNLRKARMGVSTSLLIALLALALSGSKASAQQKKTVPAAPAKAAAPAPKAAAPANHPAAGAAGAAHTATPAAHGPTTAGHGVTTSSASHGPTTAGHATPTTAGHATPTTAGHAGMNDHRAGGAMNEHHAEGASFRGHATPAGNHVVRGAHGEEIRRGPHGEVRDVHTAHGMDIHHGLDGHRRVEVERADHSRIVAERGGRGYIEHPYRYHDREFAHRTYYYNGRAYDHYYGRYQYHGVFVNYYTPAFYYRPAFYGWAYNPWVAPVPYAWGWAGNPWYGYYGSYFTPYPVYASASLWLTDYMISTSLAAAYQAQVAAAAVAQGGPPPDAAPLTPEVKEMISAEVQRQIALENAESASAQTAVPDPASSSIQRMLTDNVRHVFLVGNGLDVVNSAGGECAVSQGDALQLVGPPPPDSPTASMLVLSSKGGIECRRNDTVLVQITDLQEMQNHMRETIDAGMGEMQNRKPGSTLPAIPTSATGAPVKATFMTDAPPPDANVATEINQQLQVADKEEPQVVAQTSQDSGSQQTASSGTTAVPSPLPPPAAPPTEISIGETVDEVTAALGTPLRTADLGTKKVYIYKDIKVTFKNGKVSDVQ